MLEDNPPFNGIETPPVLLNVIDVPLIEFIELYRTIGLIFPPSVEIIIDEPLVPLLPAAAAAAAAAYSSLDF